MKIQLLKRILLFCSLSILCFYSSNAQLNSAVDSIKNIDLTPQKDTLKPDRIWSAAPLIFYTPETKLAFGVGGLYFFRPHKRIKAGKTISNEAAIILYSLRGQFQFQIVGEFYADNDQWRATHDVFYERFPDRFFGIGNNTAEEDEEKFTRSSVGTEIAFLRGFNNNFYVGLNTYIASHEFTNLEDSGLLDLGLVPGVEGGFDWGIGPQILFDSRDNNYFPNKGSYIFSSAVIHSAALGSSQQYTDIIVDLRQFFDLGKSHILALQAYGQFIPGEPPFHRMALLGGSDMLRGFFEGQYRDRYYVAVQSEYRFPIWKFIRGTAFMAVGDVSNNYNTFDIGDVKYAGGLGLRLIVSEKDGINLRFDYGLGKGLTKGFYFQFSEAF
ncbi:MAG: outer membrane protein assembly factor BamA [Limisphaerales bacterium]|jgi:outer membrane protein assembly factor BamA